MGSLLANLLFSLSEALEKDERVLSCREKEKSLEKDEEAKKLSLEVQAKSSIYEENRNHFGVNSPEAEESLHQLYLAKKKLDELPSSLEYTSSFIKMRDLYDQIDALLFGDFRSLVCKRKS